MRLDTLRRYEKGYFWVGRDEVAEVMRRSGFATVTEAMRLLFPRLLFYKCARRNGYWGREVTPCA